MAEYWKSTPRYWCKHCSTYVRDTKLERQNHDATAKHQSAIKRSLRDLHRGKEREEREKERAKREVDRLNGVVNSSSSSSRTGGALERRGGEGSGGALGGEERKRQVEQLASLGVSIPDAFRPDLAMAGEWTVTSTTVVQSEDADNKNPDAIARGVHKRERTEDEVETEEAVKGLFKKPRQWGRDSKTADEGSEDLDALLGGGLVVKKKDEDEPPAKKKEEADEKEEGNTHEAVKQEGSDVPPSIKEEPSNDDMTQIPDDVPAMADGDKSNVPLPLPLPLPTTIKTEDDGAGGAPADTSAPAVVFKKRKPKNVRQK